MPLIPAFFLVDDRYSGLLYRVFGLIKLFLLFKPFESFFSGPKGSKSSYFVTSLFTLLTCSHVLGCGTPGAITTI
jgi:hypothetical protein